MRALLVFSGWLVLATGLGAYWIAHAQQAAQDGPRITGQSASLDVEGLRISRRRFEPGARSAWHRHTHGQLLFVAEGAARTQQRGAPMREMEPGDSDYTPPNVVHWHGAAPHTHFIQVAVGFGDGTDWFEDVSDDAYDGR